MTDEQCLPIGPWEYFPAQNYEGFAIAPRGRLPTLAAVERKGSITVFNYPGATESHARLIAAAPELLDALRLILPLAKGYMPQGQSEQARLTCNSWIAAADEVLERFR